MKYLFLIILIIASNCYADSLGKLWEGAKKGDRQMVQQALNDGADPTKISPFDKKTPLELSLKYNDAPLIKSLLEKKANPNETYKKGMTPLIFSAENGFTEVVSALLDHSAEVDQANNAGNTALMRAAEKGHTDIIAALLDAGAQVNNENNRGRTALYYASYNGHNDVVQLLLKHGADQSKRALQTNTGRARKRKRTH